MKNSWAQAQKDARHLSTFLQTLANAQEIFVQVGEAEAELAHLREKNGAMHAELADLEKQVTIAREDAEAFVIVSRGRTAALKITLAEAIEDVLAKRKALDEEAERDRLDFVAFKGTMARDRQAIEARHQGTIRHLKQAEEVALASLNRVEKQRQDMIQELSKEMPDAS